MDKKSLSPQDELDEYFTGKKKLNTEEDSARVMELLYDLYIVVYYSDEELQDLWIEKFRENLQKAKQIGVNLDTAFGIFGNSLLGYVWQYSERSSIYLIKVMEELINEGADINFQDRNGDTIFHNMAQVCKDSGETEREDRNCSLSEGFEFTRVMPKKFLSNKNLNLKLKNYEGQTAIEVALEKGNLHIAMYFHSMSGLDLSFEEIKNRFLKKDTFSGEINQDSEESYLKPSDILKGYFSGEKKIETIKDSSKIMEAIGLIYMRAARFDSDWMQNTTIENIMKAKEIGVDLDAPYGCYDYSLLRDIWQFSGLEPYKTKIMEKLIKEGANINIQDKHGKTLLHDMVISVTELFDGYVQSSGRDPQEIPLSEKFLSDKNLDLNEKDHNGQTPFQLAMIIGNERVAKFLHEKSGSNLSYEEVRSKFFGGEDQKFSILDWNIASPFNSLTGNLKDLDLQ